MDELPKAEQSKVKHHIKKHKVKYSAASVGAAIIAALQLWPILCPMLPFKVQCVDTKPLAQFGQTKLDELKDAGSL